MNSIFHKLLRFIILLALAVPAAAQTRPSVDLPLLFSADEVTRDGDLGVIKAAGNVEISQGERVLLADNVSYNLEDNIVTASGNISLLEPSGDVLFANYMELSGDLKDGVISGFGLGSLTTRELPPRGHVVPPESNGNAKCRLLAL